MPKRKDKTWTKRPSSDDCIDEQKEGRKRKNPAGSFDTPSRLVRIKPIQRPKLEVLARKRAPKVLTDSVLKGLADKFKSDNPTGHERAKDPGTDAAALAKEIANGPFVARLAKIKGHNPEELTMKMIDYIRLPATPAEPAKPESKEKPPKGLTERQERQRLATRRPPPMKTSTTKRRKGKSMPPKDPSDPHGAEGEARELQGQDALPGKPSPRPASAVVDHFAGSPRRNRSSVKPSGDAPVVAETPAETADTPPVTRERTLKEMIDSGEKFSWKPFNTKAGGS